MRLGLGQEPPMPLGPAPLVSAAPASGPLEFLEPDPLTLLALDPPTLSATNRTASASTPGPLTPAATCPSTPTASDLLAPLESDPPTLLALNPLTPAAYKSALVKTRLPVDGFERAQKRPRKRLLPAVLKPMLAYTGFQKTATCRKWMARMPQPVPDFARRVSTRLEGLRRVCSPVRDLQGFRGLQNLRCLRNFALFRTRRPALTRRTRGLA